MEFNTFKKGYSAVKQFEHTGLYVSFGCCCAYNDDSPMAIVSLDKPRLYVVGGGVFRAKLNDIMHKECSDTKKRELFVTEAIRLIVKELQSPTVFKKFIAEIMDSSFQSGQEAARAEIRAALGLGSNGVSVIGEWQ